MKLTILGIESSCDDTSAAVAEDGFLLSNKIANQQVHRDFGGVVPELASRAHQQNIIPVVDAALREAGRNIKDVKAVAYTRGPGLMGALLVGSSFAKGLSLALKVPLIDVNHLLAHILSVFIVRKDKALKVPEFPFLCLVVSGGHTLLVIMHDHLKMEIIGQTIDDAAGEAFDKCAKVMGLPYPGGPLVDRNAKNGNPNAFKFAKASIRGLDFSFSGLKTSFLYFLRDQMIENKEFINQNLNDLCASIQKAIVESLTSKLLKAAQLTNIKEIAVVGGVSANSGLREAVVHLGKEMNWSIYIPEIQYSTDNAAMIAITGYYKFLDNQFSSHSITPVARFDQL
ncbi:MAG TPA: tRNA (adenosine(37)-N6)-threonylcarbamoyltransferase complex transferase subunit TsaD [Bacteroidales bacterium]|jgi:N6-L-threonylcarbamoyladenine synthase|nr:tRNA (adenosine(37)-N6)-threonylcarbamoyltransferase complex transferase subunit TsaD [Bacteroidales bacterium]